MAFGMGKDPGLSVSAQLDDVEFPVWREQLAKLAMDNEASVDVINVLKCLPESKYDSKEAVLRDLGEASRRFATGNHAPADDDSAHRDRRNIGRDAVENAPAPRTRHP